MEAPSTAEAKAHDTASAELVTLLRELGMVRAQIARGRAEAWAQGAHLGVTERRENASMAVAGLVAQAEELSADVEAQRVLLRTVEFAVGWENR